MAEIAATLAERGKQYGDFVLQAGLALELKEIVRRRNRWKTLAADQQEAIEMIFVKISRAVNGNPDHIDTWTDIQGYAALVEKRLVNDYYRKGGT